VGSLEPLQAEFEFVERLALAVGEAVLSGVVVGVTRGHWNHP